MQPLSTDALEAKGEELNMVDSRHPLQAPRETVGVYVWQYPLRLFHWGMVLSIVALSFTGYYIHDPFIIGQMKYPFLMGWFRFVHETFGMLLLALFIVRMAMFFIGNSWVGWRRNLPLRAAQWIEMVKVAKFYLFINPRPVSRIGHNAMAAFAYICIYALVAFEVITGLVLYTNLGHNGFLRAIVGWIPGLINVQNLRLIHFCLMFVFLAFAVFHIHLSMLISREEKRGLIDSIFVGWKVIPVDELHAEEEETAELLRKAGK